MAHGPPVLAMQALRVTLEKQHIRRSFDHLQSVSPFPFFAKDRRLPTLPLSFEGEPPCEGINSPERLAI